MMVFELRLFINQNLIHIRVERNQGLYDTG